MVLWSYSNFCDGSKLSENFQLMEENTHQPAFTTDLQYPPYLKKTVEILSCFSHIELLIYA